MYMRNINVKLPFTAFQPGAVQGAGQRKESLLLQQASLGVNVEESPVQVEVSDEARKKSFVLRESKPEGLPAEFLSHEAAAQRKAETAKMLAEPKEIDPFENEFQILGVTATFMEGTLEDFISDKLGGKLKNASMVASELGKMIRGTFGNPDASVEERAIDRETALSHARYLAENYFDDPDDAKAFLKEIQRFADNDILREKGYVVFDNSDMKPFKSYMSSVRDSDSVNLSAYAKLYRDSNALEKDSDPQKAYSFFNSVHENNANVLELLNTGGFNALYNAISKNKQEWDALLSENFAKNEQYVSDIIDKAKDSLDEDRVAKSLARLMKAF
jgi:hypothetical protein